MNAELASGTQLGVYVLDSLIGRGGFGVVWRGHNVETGALVAVKILTGAASNSDKALLRAEVELLAGAASRRSPHVVAVLGGGYEPLPYLALEYVDGVDLAAVLRDEGKLTVDRTIDIGLAVADALSALNDAGIIHRDIKPANVMIARDGAIKLADFGIAKIIGYETITAAGEVALTMAYAAPEVWDNGDGPYGAVSHQSDLYALGTLLFECLAGATPFRGNYGALYRDHRERRPDLDTLPAETPASVRELIRRCLEKRPSDRPADAAACTAMLLRARVELAEVRGEALAEPRLFGGWRRLRPNERLPWAWHCRNEASGVEATVEVHFAADVHLGTTLRRALAVNPRLVALGAERLLETNRLILRPGEEWTDPPDGRFQFWVAREETARTPQAQALGVGELRRLATSLEALIAAARAGEVTLAFPPAEVSLTAGGLVLHRPGLVPPQEDATTSALRLLSALDLDVAARALLAATPDLHDLAGSAAASVATTVLVDGATTVLVDADRTRVEPAPGAAAVSPARPAPPAAQPALTVCQACGARVAGSDAFCGNCGRPLAAVAPALRCPHCGTPAARGDVFCGNCGGYLGLQAGPSVRAP